MLNSIGQLQDQVDEVKADVDYEIETFAHSDKRKELLKQVSHRLKQAWHLLDEAAEL